MFKLNFIETNRFDSIRLDSIQFNSIQGTDISFIALFELKSKIGIFVWWIAELTGQNSFEAEWCSRHSFSDEHDNFIDPKDFS